MTPFKALYGGTPPSITDYVPRTMKVASLDKLLHNCSLVLSRLKENINRAQQRMQHQTNKHRKDVSFAVDEFVFVKLRPYRQQSLHRRYSPKLAMRFYVPYCIIEKIGEVAYQLELPPKAKIYNVFHVSVLKLCPNPQHQTPADLPDCFLGLTCNFLVHDQKHLYMTGKYRVVQGASPNL
ncbi:unnamed protein product [Rhodiola kirilowii]